MHRDAAHQSGEGQVEQIGIEFIADIRQRMERAVSLCGVDPAKAEKTVRKADKQRASYYNYYATATWGDVNNYDLCVDTGKLGIDGTVELIEQYLRLREQALKNAKE